MLTPYEAVWRFFFAEQRGNEEDHLSARIALEQAIELQPGYAEAWAAWRSCMSMNIGIS